MNEPISTYTMLARVFAAAGAGALIGFERERHGRPAGLRTTMLAGIAAAVAMIVSENYFLLTPAGNWRPDPGRIGAGVLTGIGFLGAGTILRQNDAIIGVTTAASLWLVTVLGLAFGAGLFVLGSIGTGAALLILVLLPLFENQISRDCYSTLKVTMEIDSISEPEFRRRLAGVGLELKRLAADYDLPSRRKTLTCDLKFKTSGATDIYAQTLATLRDQPGILHIQWS